MYRRRDSSGKSIFSPLYGVDADSKFRVSSISGRSTHVSKLRSEFDAGGDFDLLECGPGEIDPHAVSSILKAYLREREFYVSNEHVETLLTVFLSS